MIPVASCAFGRIEQSTTALANSASGSEQYGEVDPARAQTRRNDGRKAQPCVFEPSEDILELLDLHHCIDVL